MIDSKMTIGTNCVLDTNDFWNGSKLKSTLLPTSLNVFSQRVLNYHYHLYKMRVILSYVLYNDHS